MQRVKLDLTPLEADALLWAAETGCIGMDTDEPWERGEKARTRRGVAKLRNAIKELVREGNANPS